MRSAARRLGAGPVGSHREVVAHVEPLVEPPGGVLGREVEGARGDVDVGDLHRDGLELGQAAAELGPALDVRRGEVARSGDHAGGGQAQTGDVPLGEQLDGALPQQLGPGAVEDHRVPRDPCARAGLEQRDTGIADVDERDDRGLAVHRRDEQVSRPVCDGHVDLAAADLAVGVRRRGSAADRPPGLAERRREQQLAAHDAGEQRLLLLVGAGPGDDQRAAAERLPDRQVPGAGPGVAQQHAHLGQPESLAAVGLRDGEPEQPGLGQLGPAAIAVEHVGEHRPDRRERLCLLAGHARGPPA